MTKPLPDEALACLQEARGAVADERVELVVRDRFAYVECEDTPICRLGFTGDLQAWELAMRG